ncbi:unnamed protein product [Orchesella dallaii]|uniref:Uncharacterized protein n=1 Tax=Orchesella dallaii TaxID=48710 RepID=A0ABP1PSU5_9HEXA
MVDPDNFIPNQPVDPIKRSPDSKCLLPERYQEGMEHIQGIVAWNLRGKLCTCAECVEMYQTLSVTFLIDDEDSMENYCKVGLKAHENRVETKIGDFDKTLGTLDRYSQGRLAEGTNNLLKGLKRMLSSKTDGTPVTVDDVTKMMTNVRKKRR